MIQNLAENAVKYAPCGSQVTIEVAPDVSADAAMAPVAWKASRPVASRQSSAHPHLMNSP